MDSSSNRKSDAQSKHGYETVERAVFPLHHAASCREQKWTCDVIGEVTTTVGRFGGGGGRTIAAAVPKTCAAHLDAGAIFLRDGAAYWRHSK